MSVCNRTVAMRDTMMNRNQISLEFIQMGTRSLCVSGKTGCAKFLRGRCGSQLPFDSATTKAFQRISDRHRRLVKAKASNDIESLLNMLETPEVDDDLIQVQTEDGALFDEAGLAVSFGNDSAALQALENEVVIVDRSHWGRLRITGNDRIAFLHGQSTADIKAMKPGEGASTVLVTPQARCTDLGLCLVQDSGLTLILSPGLDLVIQERFEKYIFPADNVQIKNINEETSMFSICGPAAMSIMDKLNAGDFTTAKAGSHTILALQNDPVVVIANSGLPYPGYTFICGRKNAAKLWSALTQAGAVPMGENAWEIARVVAGRPAIDKEITEDYTPFDAALYESVSLNKGCYIGQETLAKVYNQGAQLKELWGIELEYPVSPGDDVYLAEDVAKTDADSKPLGKITSFVDRPILTYAGPSVEHRALAYLRKRVGNKTFSDMKGLKVVVGGVEGRVIDTPFSTRTLSKNAQPKNLDNDDETDNQAEEDRKAAKLAEMQARIAAWRSQNE